LKKSISLLLVAGLLSMASQSTWAAESTFQVLALDSMDATPAVENDILSDDVLRDDTPSTDSNSFTCTLPDFDTTILKNNEHALKITGAAAAGALVTAALVKLYNYALTKKVSIKKAAGLAGLASAAAAGAYYFGETACDRLFPTV